MNRIDQRFEQLRQSGKAAFIPFLTIGDPTVEISEKIIHELVQSGADCIELGVPYSDPLADGPVIQRASMRALTNEINISVVLELAAKCRKDGIETPFVLFTYYNPILQMGIEEVFESLKNHQIDGVIIPDLPYEESAEVNAIASKHGIHVIPLVAPTSNDRIAKICEHATGFIYCVSSLGVTGVRSDFYAGIDQFLETVRQSSSLPICVGFGISTQEQFASFAKKCDGVVVGSAIVRTVEEVLDDLKSPETHDKGIEHIRNFVAKLTTV